MPLNHIKRSRHIIRSFEAQELKKRPFIVKVVDALTTSFGTIAFLLGNLIIYGFWILANTGKIPGIPIIDPYPYSFMNSFVSIEAIFLSIIVLMSQNRENQRDTLRSELGLQVELISEKEITKILDLLREILENQKNHKHDSELEEMTEELDAGYIERKLIEQLENSEGQPIVELKEKIKERIIK
ncbi:MAG: hypothetical protein ACD_13C00142G0015 [uncultured bacterium]|nr:MAG: hypothetical protein ACD_13C00142G0015 [uncultured bacterium]KKR54213.1 MAG: hypothetical protein UT88_C0002G0025 [Candidatus Woesebacteria bacterium GW2011_GWD2_40_19]KKR56851.1 MAG: hypothetical protein UT96_C0032G0015 [Candidatus Woesebacteria bacterium GW2011_GWC2_40_30]HAU65678.1 hypothetical protein [Candidatus Woesebacteria bacterium]HCC08466.1 hypothetical protein [Candidatus Woesebacteria bacterium]